MFLRDARHLDKFLFSLSDPLFYEPYESSYIPSQEFISLISILLEPCHTHWSAAREGFWFHVHPSDFHPPSQGWKIHVSATLDNASDVLRAVASVAVPHGIAFKVALDRNILSLFSSKRWPRGSAGKFITLYPVGDHHYLKSFLETLYNVLKSFEGPYILSDIRYKNCQVLYYRYGGFRQVTQVDIMGRHQPMLISPNGDVVPDLRTPFFTLPTWVLNPFHVNSFTTPESVPEYPEGTLGNGRFLISTALAFSNSGGIYLATDNTTGKDVVIKEARPHTLMDGSGNDAICLLKKERDILELLHNSSIAPHLITSFVDWENFYLVQELIDGVDIRVLMLTQSPLMKVHPTLEDTSHFYGIFQSVFHSFLKAVALLHGRGIVFGDMSADNLKVDPLTYAVTFIDFEGAFRIGVDKATSLFTPGFRHTSNTHKIAPEYVDDLFGSGAVMLYTLFPLHALSHIKSDLYSKVLDMVITDLGWSETRVSPIIKGLTDGSLSASDALQVLQKPVSLNSPSYSTGVSLTYCDDAIQHFSQFLLEHMTPDSTTSLFPADPFLHRTNPLSIGFGACGVLYSLSKCDVTIPGSASAWLERSLDRVDLASLAPGLLTGTAGIAWSLWELGLNERALHLMNAANGSSLRDTHHSFFYGMAGIGMANLFFYLNTQDERYLEAAVQLGERLLASSFESSNLVHWSDGNMQLGYGYGSSGVALFLLRLFQVTGVTRYFSYGHRAVQFDLSHATEVEEGVRSLPRAPGDLTVEPYMEEGSAGVIRVALRFGLLDALNPLIEDLNRKYSRFAGLLYGLGGFIDVLNDASLFSGKEYYATLAHRPLAGIRDMFLIKYPYGWATPGDGLTRISCDYATGIAGVLRAFYRYKHGGGADFTLDQLQYSSWSHTPPPATFSQSIALSQASVKLIAKV